MKRKEDGLPVSSSSSGLLLLGAGEVGASGTEYFPLLKLKRAAPALGFLRSSTASVSCRCSGMKKARYNLARSPCALAGSPANASLDRSASSAKRVGTGPARMLPSHMVAAKGQDSKRTVGMLSLRYNNWL